MSKIRMKGFWEGHCHRGKHRRKSCAGSQPELPVLGHNVIKAAYRIHEAGGCDATDPYSRGYDDAVTLALDIILEETGLRMCDVLDYGEGI